MTMYVRETAFFLAGVRTSEDLRSTEAQRSAMKRSKCAAKTGHLQPFASQVLTDPTLLHRDTEPRSCLKGLGTVGAVLLLHWRNHTRTPFENT